MGTFNSAGSGNANADATWTEAGQPAAGDHVIIGSHTVTLTAHEAWGSVQITGGGTLAGGGYTLTLNDGGNSTIFDHDGTITGHLDVTLTGGTSRNLDIQSVGSIRTLIINNGSSTFTLSASGTHTVTTLTITAGELDTGSDRALTVTGTTTVDGTLTLNASTVVTASVGGTGTVACGTANITCSDNFNARTITMDAATLDIADRLGEANGTGGTVTVSGTSTATISCLRMPGTRLTPGHSTLTLDGGTAAEALDIEGAGSCWNVIVNSSGTKTMGSAITIANDLTITAGTLDTGSNYALTVDGDVSIADGGILTGNASAIELGSLTIEDGGEYNATSGTTTLAGQTGTNNLCFKCTAGTFTHNNGTLNITGNTWGTSSYAHIWVGTNQDFGNVTINAGADSKYYQFRAGSTTFYFNNFYAKYGEIRDYNNNNTFHIRGNLDIGTRGAGGTAGYFGESEWRDNDNTCKTIVDGLVTVYTDGQFHVAYGTDGTDGCKVGGIRNVGGTVYAVEQDD